MNISSELIVRAMVSIAIVYISYKLISHFLINSLDNITTNLRKPHHDFDKLVNRYKRELGFATKKINSPSPASSESNKTLKKYTDQLALLAHQELVNSDQYRDIETIISLITNLNWGAGDEYQELADKLSQTSIIKFTTNDLINILKEAIELNILLQFKDDYSIKLIKEILMIRMTIEILIRDTVSTKHEVIEAICKSKEIDTVFFCKAIIYLILKSSGKSSDKIIKELLEPQTQLIDLINKLPREKIKNAKWNVIRKVKSFNLLNQQELLQKIFKEARMFEFIHPPVSKTSKKENEHKWACEILNCSIDADAQEIKKSFKRLAKQKHPDLLNSHNLPAKYHKLAHANFIIIQEAYGIAAK